jgi:hypothetical protein
MSVKGRNFNHHIYRFYNNTSLGKKGCVGRSPCRSSIKKLTPQDVLNRADLCGVSFWDYCVLVDGKDQILDIMTQDRAWNKRYHNIVNQLKLR